MGWFSKKGQQPKGDLRHLSWSDAVRRFLVERDRTILRHWINHNTQSNGLIFTQLDLRHVNLAGCKLAGSNFRYTNCIDADFSGTRLVKAEFIQARLDNCNFEDANLNEACFAGASLRNANLRHAALIKTDFVNADLRGVEFVPAQLVETMNLEHALLTPGYLADAVAAGYKLMKDR